MLAGGSVEGGSFEDAERWGIVGGAELMIIICGSMVRWAEG